ncbi:hypothetical protein ABPG74_016315 [Tetrahymena malaccensis]
MKKNLKAFKEDPKLSLRKYQKDESKNPKNMGNKKLDKYQKLKDYLHLKHIQDKKLMWTSKNRGLLSLKIRLDEPKNGKLYFSQMWLFCKKDLQGTNLFGNIRELILNPLNAFKNRNALKTEFISGVQFLSRHHYFNISNRILNSEKYCSLIDEMKNHIDEELLVITNYLKQSNIEYMEDWPPKGADISPIECVWVYYQGRNIQFEDDILGERLFEAINNKYLTSLKIRQLVKRLYLSLPLKIQKIIESKGQQINF